MSASTAWFPSPNFSVPTGACTRLYKSGMLLHLRTRPWEFRRREKQPSGSKACRYIFLEVKTRCYYFLGRKNALSNHTTRQLLRRGFIARSTGSRRFTDRSPRAVSAPDNATFQRRSLSARQGSPELEGHPTMHVRAGFPLNGAHPVRIFGFSTMI